MQCPKCDAPVAPYHITCGACGVRLDGSESVDRSTPAVCTACGTDCTTGVLEVRAGGMQGMGRVFLPDLADMSERIVRFRTETCPACGHVDLYRG